MATSDPQTKAHNDRNVYIFGAGFSADAGLPLIKDFMNRMRDAAAWLGSQTDREREIAAIDRVLQFRLEATGAAYRVPIDVDNVEELFSLASASADETLGAAMPLAIAATLDFCRTLPLPLEKYGPIDISIKANSGLAPRPHWGPPSQQWAGYVQRPGDNMATCPRYEFYLGLIGGYFNPGGPDRRDTIITFNYDTVVEEALEGLNLPFAYGDPKHIWMKSSERDAVQHVDNRIRVLKLHGSINWVNGLEFGLTQRERALSFHERIEELGRVIVVCKNYNNLRQMGHTPLLVAPTWQKVFSGHLAAIWKDAVQALKTATRVIILGYSMPPTDQHFKYLMAAGLQDNISLRKIFFVNPTLNDDAERSKLEERLFSLFRREHFERGVIELVPMNVGKFFVGSGTEENGRLRIGRTLNPPGQSYDESRCVGPGLWQ